MGNLKKIKKVKAKFNAVRVVALAFLTVVLIGTFLLMLPISSANGQWTDFTTALFTATTSTCVTGLVVVPTYLYWSVFGKVIILILIQIGGLGMICIVMGFLLMIGKHITLKERRLMQEAYNLDSAKGIVKSVKSIFLGTFLVEAMGAALYSIRFIPRYGVVKGICYSVFHSVSAFCNAGIDIIGDDSFMPFRSDVLVLSTTMILIIVGGIGFIVWWDVFKIFRKIGREKLPPKQLFERLSLHSKIVFTTTLILLVIGTLTTLVFEYDNPETIGNMSIGGKILASMFQSVTLRTAGFSIMNQQIIRNATFIIACLMMLIGGSPMGTAGGIKTTTIGLLFLEVKAVIQGKSDVEVFHRRIDRNNIKTALSVIFVAVSVLTVAILGLTITEDAPLKELVFEAFSAIGTVGLSMNLTAGLSTAGRIIITILMFFGRVGPITIVMALGKRRKTQQHTKDLPVKKVMIG